MNAKLPKFTIQGKRMKISNVKYLTIICIASLIQISSLSSPVCAQSIANPKPGKQEDTKTNSKENNDDKNTVDRVTLAKLRDDVREYEDFNLDEIAKITPKIFKDDSAEYYFQNIFGASPFDDHIYSNDIRNLAVALLDHAVIASKKNDWKRTKKSLNLALDLALLPTEKLKLPQQVMLYGTNIKVPGMSHFWYLYNPARTILQVLGDSLNNIYANSGKNKSIKDVIDSREIFWKQSKDNTLKIVEFDNKMNQEVVGYKKKHSADKEIDKEVLELYNSYYESSEYKQLNVNEEKILVDSLMALKTKINNIKIK